MLDPISDTLTRIRNAQKAGHSFVVLPSSKIKMAIIKILENTGFIELAKKEKAGKFEKIKVFLRYNKISGSQKEPAISGIQRISREGQRIYVKKDRIRKVKSGYGIAIISTSKGVMTGEEARKLGLGGEYICEVW